MLFSPIFIFNCKISYLDRFFLFLVQRVKTRYGRLIRLGWNDTRKSQEQKRVEERVCVLTHFHMVLSCAASSDILSSSIHSDTVYPLRLGSYCSDRFSGVLRDDVDYEITSRSENRVKGFLYLKGEDDRVPFENFELEMENGH